MNIERYRMVMHRIWADLRTWRQSSWHWVRNSSSSREYQRAMNDALSGRHTCGTSHCVAGWSQILAGKSILFGFQACDTAQEWLELNSSEADYLFSSERTLADLNAVLTRGRVFE